MNGVIILVIIIAVILVIKIFFEYAAKKYEKSKGLIYKFELKNKKLENYPFEVDEIVRLWNKPGTNIIKVYLKEGDKRSGYIGEFESNLAKSALEKGGKFARIGEVNYETIYLKQGIVSDVIGFSKNDEIKFKLADKKENMKPFEIGDLVSFWNQPNSNIIKVFLRGYVMGEGYLGEFKSNKITELLIDKNVGAEIVKIEDDYIYLDKDLIFRKKRQLDQ